MLGLVMMQVASPATPVTRSSDTPLCTPTKADEVLVCARLGDQERYRLRPPDPRYAEPPRGAVQTTIPGVGTLDTRAANPRAGRAHPTP